MKRLPLIAALTLASLTVTACSAGMAPSALPSDAPQGASVGRSREVTTSAVATTGMSDNFESDAVSGPASGWTSLVGSWTICQKASSHEYCPVNATDDISVAGNARWTDYVYDAYVIDRNVAIGTGSIIARVQDAANFYELGLRSQNGTPRWHLWRVQSGIQTELAGGPFSQEANPHYHFRLALSGATISAYVAKNYSTTYTLLATVADTTFSTGAVGVRATGSTEMRYDNVVVSAARANAISATPTPTASGSASATSQSTETPSNGSGASPLPSVGSVLPSLPPSMTARSADDFVASMGVDVDLVNSPSSQQAAIASSFAGLGVRHARISILEDDPSYEANVRAFFSKNPNVRAYGITNCAPKLGGYLLAKIGPSDVSGFQSRTGNVLDRIESVNEPNGRNDPNWVADTRSCIAPLAGNVGGVPLVAPALILNYGGADSRSLGAVTGVAMGNIHRYFAGRNPDTSGWGASDACGTYGSLAWAICWAKLGAPGKPLVVTETGWNSQTEVDEAVQAKYVERVFFVNWQAGIAATSLYTFESYAKGDGFGGDGLVRTDLSPKPAYNAVANITRLLSDPGATYTPAATRVGIVPAPVANGNGLRAMLLGKRNGSYDLALWQEVQSANPDKYGSDTPAMRKNVTITLGAPGQVSMDAWQDNGNTEHSSLGIFDNFVVPVTDRLTIVEFKML